MKFDFAFVERFLQLENAVKELQTRMAKQDDELAQVASDLAAMQTDFTTISTGIAGLNAQIQQLKDQLAGGVLTAAQQAALDNVVASADSLKSTADQIAAGFPASPGTSPTGS